ncbi:hypothetical protein [Burkholderia territorii]|nr:hypothetical protein [Burkholderia territorii]
MNTISWRYERWATLEPLIHCPKATDAERWMTEHNMYVVQTGIEA